MPFTCESVEKIGDKPVMRFRINDKAPVIDNGIVRKLHVVGVTPHEGFRKIIYGQGRLTASEIGMTFLKDSFVLGKVEVYNRGEEGVYEGEARISDFNKGKPTPVRCIDSEE